MGEKLFFKPNYDFLLVKLDTVSNFTKNKSLHIVKTYFNQFIGPKNIVFDTKHMDFKHSEISEHVQLNK